MECILWERKFGVEVIDVCENILRWIFLINLFKGGNNILLNEFFRSSIVFSKDA
jgi:hypothetical protein